MSIFVTADERLAKPPTVNICIVAEVGKGKTYQASTLPPNETCFVNIESGMQSVGSWGGVAINVRDLARKLGCHPWELCRAIACVVSGPNPAVKAENPYSQASYEKYCAALGGAELFERFKYMYWDSLTVAANYCFEWSQMQPDAFNAQGKPDTRGAYGLVGRELVDWYRVIQHTPNKSTIVVAILDRTKDEFGRDGWKLQITGSKGAEALPGIFDQVIALVDNLPDSNNTPQRAFVCQTPNPLNIPSLKSRGPAGGALEVVEQFGNPNLYELIKKVQSKIAGNAASNVTPFSTAA